MPKYGMKFREWLNELVAYHGSRAGERFQAFQTFGDENKWGPGAYFTPDEEEAAEWGGTVYKVELTFNMPFRSDNFMTPELFDQINQAALRLGKPLPKEFRNDKNGYAIYQLLTRVNDYSKSKANEILKSAGFDGIIDGDREFVALDPKKVKILGIIKQSQVDKTGRV
jgi:hypothetical protein